MVKRIICFMLAMSFFPVLYGCGTASNDSKYDAEVAKTTACSFAEELLSSSEVISPLSVYFGTDFDGWDYYDKIKQHYFPSFTDICATEVITCMIEDFSCPVWSADEYAALNGYDKITVTGARAYEVPEENTDTYAVFNVEADVCYEKSGNKSTDTLWIEVHVATCDIYDPIGNENETGRVTFYSADTDLFMPKIW